MIGRPLATPNNRQETGNGNSRVDLHGRDASAPLMSAVNPCLWQRRRHTGPAMSAGRAAALRTGPYLEMTATEQTSPARSGWLANRPYLLLSITALCWAGNAIVGRLAAGHIPPVTLSFLRWAFAFLIILPLAWTHLRRDWPAIRAHLGMMIVLSMTGISAFNTMQYWALEHTQALNTLLLQSAGPLFVAVWSLIVLGIRLTLAQAGGVALSLVGVLVILLHGDL